MTTSIIDYIFRELAITYLGRHDLAQVKPEDLRHDTIGQSPRTEHFAPCLAPPTGARSAGGPSARRPAAQRRRPGGPTAGAGCRGRAVDARSRRASLMTERDQARLKGYEGDPCWNCGQFTLVRNGTCLKCDSCGETSGCS